ncbi:hypothetical protein [Streptomyces sp. NPDC088762]|uniref:hypothetical protein n=1 Tax=Streptomyces sp. NPDC088762 TaxID=3365891 RepID=UPI003830EC66
MTHRRYGLTIAAVTAAALLAGCQSGGASPLSLDGLTKTVDGMPPRGADSCPLPYDLTKAAKTAGVDAPTGPGPVKDTGEPLATGDGGKNAPPGSPLAENPGALVSCTFHIGQEDLEVRTVVTRNPSAGNQLAPLTQQLAGMSLDDLTAYMKQVGEAETGEPVVTGSGNVAGVRLKPDGDGDAYLLVSVGEDGRTSLGRAKVESLASALADQVQ